MKSFRRSWFLKESCNWSSSWSKKKIHFGEKDHPFCNLQVGHCISYLLKDYVLASQSCLYRNKFGDDWLKQMIMHVLCQLSYTEHDEEWSGRWYFSTDGLGTPSLTHTIFCKNLGTCPSVSMPVLQPPESGQALGLALSIRIQWEYSILDSGHSPNALKTWVFCLLKPMPSYKTREAVSKWSHLKHPTLQSLLWGWTTRPSGHMTTTVVETQEKHPAHPKDCERE